MTGIELFLAGLGLLSLVVFLILRSNRDRPEGRLENWGIHFTTNTAFTTNDLDRAVTAFFNAWVAEYPHHSRRLRRALKKLDIIWHPRRISYNGSFVLALMESPRKISLWVGPQLRNKTRHLAYTGLFDQLALLALITHGLEPDTSKPEVRRILDNARAEIL